MAISDFFSFDIRPFTAVKVFESDEYILREGEPPQFLYYLEEGRAKLFLSHQNGKTSLINFIEAPCFIGEMELLGAQQNANGVVAISRCTCYAIDIRKCRDELLGDSKLLRHLCLFLSQKAIGNTYNYTKNQSYPLENRLAKFILMTQSNGYYRERHTEVAEFLGVTYRHLLYVLADFKNQGILEKTVQGYQIRNVKKLQSLAEHLL